jgi:SAM-dependent methyltransferase
MAPRGLARTCVTEVDMSFEVDPNSYTKFMGRFSGPLARAFVDEVGVTPGQRALDVGCGTGELTRVLVERLGVDAVAAVDPSPPFIESVQATYPDLDAHLAGAEDMPFADAVFDVVLAQLVVLFMADTSRGIGEMIRTAKPGGVVAANVWDHGGGKGPLSPFWEAVRAIDADGPDETHLPGVHEGQLATMLQGAGLEDVNATLLTVSLHCETFDDWWNPFLLGVGPAGAYVAELDADNTARLRDVCQDLMGPGPFDAQASAWTAWGHRAR